MRGHIEMVVRPPLPVIGQPGAQLRSLTCTLVGEEQALDGAWPHPPFHIG